MPKHENVHYEAKYEENVHYEASAKWTQEDVVETFSSFYLP